MPKKSRIVCPECLSSKLWKDGIRYTSKGEIQRYICRSCGFRFSESTFDRQVKLNIAGQILEEPDSGKNFSEANIPPIDFSIQPSFESLPFQRSEDVRSHSRSKVTIAEQGLNRFRSSKNDCQASNESQRRAYVSLATETKNLAEVSREEKQAAGATATSQIDIKGKIVEFAWWLKSEGRSELTIRNNVSKLRRLAGLCNLMEQEEVKKALSNLNWKNSTKMIAVSVYTKFLEFLGMSWKPPEYRAEEVIPFIPLEKEIDQLIACCSKRTATLLQLLKETGIRIGEAAKMRWMDFDSERQTVSVRPLKGSNPRIFKVSDKLAKMLSALPKRSEYIFNRNTGVLRRTFEVQRARAAEKLKNPRLKRITFHTLRHWKGTMEYHKTKDPWHVKNVLGHKNLKSTQVYINIEHALFQTESDEFCVKVAETPEEIKALLEVGFEYVCEKDGLMFFRKRK